MRFLADENFNGKIITGLVRRLGPVDIIRVQDTDLLGRGDPEVLERAAADHRVLLTHDLATMVGFAWERVKEQQPMSGLVAIPSSRPIGEVIDDLQVLMATTDHEELENRVLFFPLR